MREKSSSSSASFDIFPNKLHLQSPHRWPIPQEKQHSGDGGTSRNIISNVSCIFFSSSTSANSNDIHHKYKLSGANLPCQIGVRLSILARCFLPHHYSCHLFTSYMLIPSSSSSFLGYPSDRVFPHFLWDYLLGGVANLGRLHKLHVLGLIQVRILWEILALFVRLGIQYARWSGLLCEVEWVKIASFKREMYNSLTHPRCCWCSCHYKISNKFQGLAQP